MSSCPSPTATSAPVALDLTRLLRDDAGEILTDAAGEVVFDAAGTD